MKKKLKEYPSLCARQSGSVLIVVIFVVVVMGLLAGTMARLEWSNQDTQSREILGTRAWFIAHSANEWALTQLYPLGASAESSDMSGRCNAINTSWSSATPRLYPDDNCQVTSMSCQNTAISTSSDDYQFYSLESVASCGGDGLFKVERSQKVVVKELK